LIRLPVGALDEFRIQETYHSRKDLLVKLLDAAIHGRDELRSQLNHVKARQVIEDGTLDLQCDGGIPAPGKYAPVAEGMSKDADGSDIAVILHLRKGGFMSMLEIIKYNGSPIIKPPTAQDLVLLMPESPGHKIQDGLADS
jgi:hypothetical protein